METVKSVMSFSDAFNFLCGKAEAARNKVFKFSQAHASAVMGIWQTEDVVESKRRPELCKRFFEQYGPYTVHSLDHDVLQWRAVDGKMFLEVGRAINKNIAAPSTPALKMYFAGHNKSGTATVFSS